MLKWAAAGAAFDRHLEGLANFRHELSIRRLLSTIGGQRSSRSRQQRVPGLAKYAARAADATRMEFEIRTWCRWPKLCRGG